MAIQVLIVDDVPHVRTMLRTTLRALDTFDVIGEATNGTEAVRQARLTRPDVVVLDLGLPDLAGHEVLAQLRSVSPAAKVVVFSGSDSHGRTSLADEVDGFVVKDTGVGVLIEVLTSLVAPHPHEAGVTLPNAVDSVSEARRFVTDLVTQWNLDALLDDAVLVVSELATNAVTHASSPCRLQVTLRPATLHIDVHDSGSGTPDPQIPEDGEEHGRGLMIVSALSTAWGLESIPGNGKRVWAELAR